MKIRLQSFLPAYVVAAIILTGCVSTTNPILRSEQVTDVDRVGDAQTVSDAVLTPLSDLNVKRADIPEVLEVMTNPYAPKIGDGCTALQAEVIELDRMLGPDFESAEFKDFEAQQTSLNSTSSVIGGLIPFRGVIRAASGAERFDKKLERAYRRGVTRRAYLKGVMRGQGCG